ncbi:hypothetical protein KGQ33_02835 [Patescibacteria group bacterium]|nr:hypothetical protein [Patescibacteria group bacterium]
MSGRTTKRAIMFGCVLLLILASCLAGTVVLYRVIKIYELSMETHKKIADEFATLFETTPPISKEDVDRCQPIVEYKLLIMSSDISRLQKDYADMMRLARRFPPLSPNSLYWINELWLLSETIDQDKQNFNKARACAEFFGIETEDLDYYLKNRRIASAGYLFFSKNLFLA